MVTSCNGSMHGISTRSRDSGAVRTATWASSPSGRDMWNSLMAGGTAPFADFTYLGVGSLLLTQARVRPLGPQSELE